MTSEGDKMKIKTLLSAVSAMCLLGATESKSFEFPDKLPYGEISANVTLATSYIWRGEVQNGNNWAVQGGFDYAVDLVDTYVSAYVGTWGSPASNTDGNLELDYYGGLSGAVPMAEDLLSYDIGLLYYDYPGLGEHAAASQDFLEYYASVGVALPYDVGLSYYYGYSPSGYGGQYDYNYQNVSLEVPVPGTPFTVFGGIGFEGADSTGSENYTDYNAGVSTSALGLDWSIYYSGTDGYGGTGVDDDMTAGGDHIVGTMSASF